MHPSAVASARADWYAAYAWATCSAFTALVSARLVMAVWYEM
jgi:hypothetical protein